MEILKNWKWLLLFLLLPTLNSCAPSFGILLPFSPFKSAGENLKWLEFSQNFFEFFFAIAANFAAFFFFFPILKNFFAKNLLQLKIIFAYFFFESGVAILFFLKNLHFDVNSKILEKLQFFTISPWILLFFSEFFRDNFPRIFQKFLTQILWLLAIFVASFLLAQIFKLIQKIFQK